MNYFAPGLREIRRRFGRLHRRIKLWLDRRELAAAETELGLLGWQQAYYDDPTQIEVDKIENAEREQARLTNAGAELAREIHEETEALEAHRQKAAAQVRELEGEQRRVREALRPIEEKIAVLKRSDPNLEKRGAEFDRELIEVEARYTKLLIVQPQPPEVRDEVFRLRERLIAIPHEKSDLQNQHMKITAELKARTQEAAELSGELGELDRRLKDLKREADAEEDGLAARIRAKEKEKARLEAESEKLERSKGNPYRAIGRVLADSGVVPMNQPHVYEKVNAVRARIRDHEAWIEQSLASTRAENPAELQASLIFGAVILIALGLILGAVL